jgi:intron-binding protein aquarius
MCLPPLLLQAVLETIRDLMNAECVVPDWLHDVFLGYGDPSAAQYKRMPNCDPHLDFNDTFLSFQHLVDSFPDYELCVSGWGRPRVGSP